MTTDAPRDASSSAIPFPIPLPEPVMRATRPASDLKAAFRTSEERFPACATAFDVTALEIDPGAIVVNLLCYSRDADPEYTGGGVDKKAK